MADYRENVVSIFVPLCSSSSFASPVIHHQLFGVKKAGALQDLVSQINSGLNSAKKRLESLRLLGCVVEQCTSAVFSSHCQAWLNLLFQCAQSHTSPVVHQYTMHVLSLVIERVSDFPELAREVGTSYIARLLPVVLAKKINEAAISCINTCIVHFPGPTGAFKGKIEVILPDLLDCLSPPQTILRCYMLLARCGTGGTQGIKHREGWAEQCNKLVTTLRALLTQLYEGLETGQEEGEDVIFTSRPLPASKPEAVASLVSRFQVLCRCLDTLVREPFPTWIPLPAEDLLDLVCRILAVQIPTLFSSKTTDHLLLLSYLPLLHCSALHILSRLIVCCKKLLLPQSSVIFQLCVQCLTSTHTQPSEAGQERPLSKLREAAYSVLTTWLQVMGSACQGVIDDEMDDFLAEIFHDIQLYADTPIKIDSKNASSNDLNPPPSKKKKKGRSGYQEMTQGGGSQWGKRRSSNMATTTSALKVLQLLITYAGNSLNSQLFQMVQQRLGNLTLSVLQNQPPPYTSAVCRQALYQALLAAVCTPRPDAASFLQGALALFQQGSLDSDAQVSHTCQEAIHRCSGLIHTITPNVRTSLAIPVVHNSNHAAPSSFTAFSSGKTVASVEHFESNTLSAPANTAELPKQTSVVTEKSDVSNAVVFPVSGNAATLLPHCQTQEKPSSTSSVPTHAPAQSSSVASDMPSSSKDGTPSVSSTFSDKTLEKSSRKRKQSSSSETEESEPDTKATALANMVVDDDDDESEDGNNTDRNGKMEKDSPLSDVRVVLSKEKKKNTDTRGKAKAVKKNASSPNSDVLKGKKSRTKQEEPARVEGEGVTSSSSEDQQERKQTEDMQAMLMTFIDAGPDSD